MLSPPTILSKIIRCSQSDPIELSVNDFILPATSSIDCIYFYDIQRWKSDRNNEANELFLDTQRMLQSLTQLIEYYPILCGTLKPSTNDGRVTVEFNDDNSGIEFISTAVTMSLIELPLSKINVDNQSILPSDIEWLNKAQSPRLFRVRHTRFACGSVALGISLNHQLGDAHSLFQLIKDWANIYRDSSYKPTVCHDRSLLSPTSDEIEYRRKIDPNFDNQKAHAIANADTPFSFSMNTEQIIVKIFRFTAEKLEQIKSKAMNYRPPSAPYISTFDALTAYLHRNVMLARQCAASTCTRIFISTNTRSRLMDPEIPLNYFGNSIVFSYVEIPMSELMADEHLGRTSSAIRQAIENNQSECIRTTLSWIASKPDISKVIPSFHLDAEDFTVSAWNKMGMYSNADFETDLYPTRVLPTSDLRFNGGAIFESTELLDSSIDVIIGLTAESMQRFELLHCNE